MIESLFLNDPLARELYETVARDLPIVDFHNHLSMAEVAEDRPFENLTRLWIRPEPYKHRAMRILGVPEYYITGEASDYETFEAWYSVLPRLAGNPLYHWSLMEMETVLGVRLEPFDRPAKEVWDEANEVLKTLTPRKLLDRFSVVHCAPCTALCEDLSVFRDSEIFAPSLRGDGLSTPTKESLLQLSNAAGIPVNGLADWRLAVDRRLREFVRVGCRFADHALDHGFSYFADDGKNEERFQRILKGVSLSEEDTMILSSYLLRELIGFYAKHSLTLQLHMGAQRKTSTRLRQVAGPAGGYAAIGNSVSVSALTALLDDAEQREFGLPRTRIFPLNPSDNAMIAVLSGSYSKDGEEALVSQGPAWWWCDHRQGMREMLDRFSVYSVLSTFLGMTTDSRSFLSFIRHDYFRRVLCDWIADKVRQGELPENRLILESLIRNVSYENAARAAGIERS